MSQKKDQLRMYGSDTWFEFHQLLLTTLNGYMGALVERRKVERSMNEMKQREAKQKNEREKQAERQRLKEERQERGVMIDFSLLPLFSAFFLCGLCGLCGE